MSINNDNLNYIVFVGDGHGYYQNYADAKQDYDEFVDDGFVDVRLYNLLHTTVKERSD